MEKAKMTFVKEVLFGVILLLSFFSCTDKNGPWKKLNTDETNYIKNIGLLEEGENILYFDSQSAFGNIKESGNFISEKRIASYWMEKDDSSKSSKNFALYEDIDSLKLIDKHRAVTYASIVEVVLKNGKRFNVYVDKDSLLLQQFYKSAVAEWEKHQRKTK